MKLFIPQETLSIDQIAEAVLRRVLQDVAPDVDWDWEAEKSSFDDSMQLLRNRFAPWFEPRLPRPGQTVGVTLSRPKTAALIFDRVWAPPEFGWRVPEEIAVHGATQHEVIIQLAAYWALIQKHGPKRRETGISDSEDSITMGCYVGAIGVAHNLAEIQKEQSLLEKKVSDGAELTVCMTLAKTHEIVATPLYSTRLRRETDLKVGDRSVLLTIMEDVALVDEKALNWEQIIEFRKDLKAYLAYRRFLHWLDGSIIGKPQNYLVDEVRTRLEAYEWALRKHGMQTVIGAIQAVFDERALLASAIGAAAVSGAGVVASLSAALAVIGGRVAIALSRGLLELEDAKIGPNSEVAYVHAVKKEFGDKSTPT